MNYVEHLDERFCDVTTKTLAVSERTPITTLLESLLDDLIDEVKPDLFLEIGAHEASFSLKMKQRFNDVPVIAIEANPRVVEQYAKYVNGEGVDYLNMAVGDSDGDVSLFIPEEIAGKKLPHVGRMASLNRLNRTNSKMSEVKVAVNTLDQIVDGYNYSRGCMWVDVEGAADKVFSSGSHALSNTALIYCELENSAVWADQALAENVSQMLEDAGFVVVARDCQKWFQYNAIFLNKLHLDNRRIDGLISEYCSAALRTFNDL